MNALIIDCSFGMAVYVIAGGKEYSYVNCNQKKHTDELLLVVDELLGQAGLKIDDITNICVCVGPGSFTGIRVAISVCKGLAVTGDVKICTATNFDVIMSGGQKSFYVLEGFSDNVYVRKADQGKVFDGCESIDNVAKMIRKNGEYEVFANNEKTQNLLNSYGISCKIAQNNTILYFKDKISKQEFVNLNEIMPIYLRESQAEIERRRRLGDGK